MNSERDDGWAHLGQLHTVNILLPGQSQRNQCSRLKKYEIQEIQEKFTLQYPSQCRESTLSSISRLNLLKVWHKHSRRVLASAVRSNHRPGEGPPGETKIFFLSNQKTPEYFPAAPGNSAVVRISRIAMTALIRICNLGIRPLLQARWRRPGSHPIRLPLAQHPITQLIKQSAGILSVERRGEHILLA